MNEADLLQHAARCGGWREHFPMKSADVLCSISLRNIAARLRRDNERGLAVALLRGG